MYSYGIRQLFWRFLLKYASIKSDLIEKYPQLTKDIEYLSSNDPSNSGKYLRWGVKVLLTGQISVQELAATIHLFHKHHQRLTNKDINSWDYSNLKEQLIALENIKTKRKEKSEIKTTGADKIYEDDQVLVLHVKTKAGACFYGANTKWCITMQNERYYEQYTSSNVIFFYLLNKTLSEKDPLYKIAVSIQRDLENKILGIDYWNAIDDKISESEVEATYPDWSKIKNIILSMTSNIPKTFLARLTHSPSTITTEEYKKEMETGEHNLYFAEQRDIPPELLPILAQDKNEEVRLAIATRWNLPLEISNMLSKDPNSRIRRTIAQRNDIDPSIFVNLAQDKETDIRSSVAANPTTPPKILAELLKDKEDIVRLYALKNEQTPIESSLTALSKESDDFKIKALQNRDYLPPDLINYLARSESDLVRMAVSELLYIPKEAKLLLSKDKIPYIRKRIAQSIVDGDNEILSSLAKDPDSLIRQEVAKRSSSPEVLALLAKDEQTKLQVAHNGKTPIEILLLLSQDKDNEIKKAVSFNRNTPDSIKKQIFDATGIGDYDTKRAAARSPKTKPELLGKLVDLGDWDLNEDLAENPNTPTEALTKLFLGSASSTRAKHKVSNNPSTSPELLSKMIDSKDESILMGIAKNPSTPPQTLEELRKRNNIFIDENLVMNPSTPENIIKEILTGKNAKTILQFIKRNYKYRGVPQQLMDRLQPYGFTV